MPSLFPSFDDPYMEQVDFRAWVFSPPQKIVDWLNTQPDRDVLRIGTYEDQNGGDCFCRFWVFLDDENDSHFHLSAARDTFFGRVPAPDSSLDEIETDAARYFGCTARGELDARFNIPASEMPKGGLIQSLGGVRFKSRGYEVSLNGGRLDLQGEELNRIRWDRHFVGQSDEHVCIDVEGFLETTIDANIFHAVTGILRKGLDHFVLERTHGEKLPAT